MIKRGLTGISADLSRRFAPLYLPGLPLSGNSARIPERESKGRRELREGRSLPKGKARGKIENGMALLFKILNRKCSCPLIENFRWKNSIKNWLRPLIFRNFLSKIFRKSKMGYAPHHLASQGASPLRGSREAADNFCLIVRKHDEARGSLGTRMTIFASLCASTMRQGEALEQG